MESYTEYQKIDYHPREEYTMDMIIKIMRPMDFRYNYVLDEKKLHLDLDLPFCKDFRLSEFRGVTTIRVQRIFAEEKKGRKWGLPEDQTSLTSYFSKKEKEIINTWDIVDEDDENKDSDIRKIVHARWTTILYHFRNPKMFKELPQVKLYTRLLPNNIPMDIKLYILDFLYGEFRQYGFTGRTCELSSVQMVFNNRVVGTTLESEQYCGMRVRNDKGCSYIFDQKETISEISLIKNGYYEGVRCNYKIGIYFTSLYFSYSVYEEGYLIEKINLKPHYNYSNHPTEKNKPMDDSILDRNYIPCHKIVFKYDKDKYELSCKCCLGLGPYDSYPYYEQPIESCEEKYYHNGDLWLVCIPKSRVSKYHLDIGPQPTEYGYWGYEKIQFVYARFKSPLIDMKYDKKDWLIATTYAPHDQPDTCQNNYFDLLGNLVLSEDKTNQLGWILPKRYNRTIERIGTREDRDKLIDTIFYYGGNQRFRELKKVKNNFYDHE